MLDTNTKRRIDTARDILVGKVPDPKSQVEQITIALIYKFMDDMDAESEELGGERNFFTGEFEKYGWSKLMTVGMGGYDMLNLYAEAITRMTENVNLPALFRDIFKNAYLPYRDPETLKMFLKTINEFEYDHSERLGDAFEYLLAVLGSQGEAGQFRTPRHIIEFIVDVVNPQKSDTVLDPACGTAGFLISAYKHILETNTDKRPGDKLTPDERSRLLNNFKGYDISPDMVRLSLVNLYLHGFVNPQVYEYDTLSSDERWNEYADVILANPPFMSPKGGIKPHKRFSVQSSRSEVLFVDYMAEHLTPTGRAGIIVPEGIIFQSSNAYKGLRKMLVDENNLWAVVSLPAGVFNPYAGVKTSILLLDKTLVKKTQEILFVKVEADGFDLGAQRRPNGKDDLPDALVALRDWQTAILQNQTETYDASSYPLPVTRIPKATLAESDYNLSADRYRQTASRKKSNWEMVEISKVCQVERGASPRPIKKFITTDEDGVNWIKIGDGSPNSMYISETKEKITREGAEKSRYVKKGDFILSNSMSFGHPYILNVNGCIHDGWLLLRPTGNHFIKEYLYYVLDSENVYEQFKQLATGGVVNNLNSSLVRSVKIPLPPLDVQQQLVNEIKGYQRIIDGARQVVEGWSPNLEFELDKARKSAGVDKWDMVKLGDICKFENGDRGKNYPGRKVVVASGIPFINAGHLTVDGIDMQNMDFISQDHYDLLNSGKVKQGDVLFCLRGSLGKHAIVDDLHEGAIASSLVIVRVTEQLENRFVAAYFGSSICQNMIQMFATGLAQPNLSVTSLKQFEIPLPPLEVQREIVSRIEAEREIVEANKKLIEIYEGKIKQVISRVWEG